MTVGWGVIGAGGIANRTIPDGILEADNARFVGITDLFAERAKSAADAFGGRVFETADEMLADPEIDAGSIGRLLGVHARYSVWWNPDVPEDTESDDEMFSLTTSRQMA